MSQVMQVNRQVSSWDLTKVAGLIPTSGGGTFGGTQPIGGINVSPGGISGCANIGGVQFCGEIPFGGGGGATTPPGEYPPAGSMPLAPSNGGPCPEGTISLMGRCVSTDPGAWAPGGTPAFFEATGGMIPKVPSYQLVTPILPAQGPRPPGYRLNKTAFYRRDPMNDNTVTYIPKGTVWVKSRRRNPANARATSRAIGRIKSAKKMAKALSQVTVRASRCGCK